MNYCNCPNCKTDNCQAAEEMQLAMQAIDAANKMIEHQANENDKLISELSRRLEDARIFLNALRLKHDLDVPEEVWSELFNNENLHR